MPKKHHDRALLIKPGSSSRAETNSRKDEVPRRSVNELLIDSRRAQVQREQSLPPTTTASIHPSLRAVLDLPPPAQPIPRRRHAGPVNLRRIPGPPPPKSWLTDSVHAPAHLRQAYGGKEFRTRVQSRDGSLPGTVFPAAGSLQHMAMKSIACNWDWHADYDHEWLGSMPTQMREIMMSYIGIYNEKPISNALKLLFMGESDIEYCSEVKRLDLSRAVGTWTSMKTLQKDMQKLEDITVHTAPSAGARTVDHPGSGTVVPDSWDELSDLTSSPSPSTLLRAPRFTNLLHLSLALAPGSEAAAPTWPALISFTADLPPRLQSLSIAYWPLPTLTPVASRTRVTVQSPGTSTIPRPIYGGTDMYSHSLDNNWREASGILRTLSRNLFNLNWLDLTGCGEWWRALTWADLTTPDEDEAQPLGPDWNGAWRGLETVVLDIGWFPSPPLLLDQQQKHSTPSRPAFSHSQSKDTGQIYVPPSRRTNMAQADLFTTRLQAMRINSASSAALATSDTAMVPDSHSETWDADVERQKYYYRKEVERHKGLKAGAILVGEELRSIRRRAGGAFIHIETNEDRV